MILQTILLAVTLSQAQAAQQADVLFPPKQEVTAPAPEIATWHGWQYLQGTTAAWNRPYPVAGDWSDVQSHFEGLKAPKPAVWRLKIVIFTRTEADGRDPGGVLREMRGTIESVQLAQVRNSLARLVAYSAAKSDGRLIILPDLDVESEWMRDSGPAAFGPDFARRYFEARINGGSYDAEDKVFRGPYNSVMYVLPGPVASFAQDCLVNETPVAAVSASPTGPNGITTTFDAALRAAWLRQIAIRVKDQGFASMSFADGAASDASDPWSTVASLEEAPASQVAFRLAHPLVVPSAVHDPVESTNWRQDPASVAMVADNERGQVLKYSEVAGFRAGGFALPIRADAAPLAKIDATPTLSFYAKATTKDPVAIRLQSSDQKVAWISLGADPRLISPDPHTVVLSMPFTSDGKWQKLSVDLKAVGKAAGLTDIASMSIEPSPNAKLGGKLLPDPVDYEFDAFQFTSDAPDPFAAPVAADASSSDPEARALFAAQAKAPSAELAALLKDKSDLVRLNATTAYIGFKDATVEQALISNSVDLDPMVSAAALAALMAEGSDEAKAIVRNSVSVSLSDYAKMAAAKLLADTKDPKVLDDVSRLSASRSWQAHVEAVQDLAEIPTPESQLWRLTFVEMTDPAVKLAWTRNADPTLDRVVSKLLWCAVNEPSDAVRSESYIKLIQSPLPANRTEGYKGVRDDSVYVRWTVTEYMVAHPSEDNRTALRTAIADRSPRVRAAALDGFAALDKGASADEIANVLDDENVEVQLALIDLAKKRALKLPRKTLDEMLASPDTRVSAAAKALGT